MIPEWLWETRSAQMYTQYDGTIHLLFQFDFRYHHFNIPHTR
jgi:hypothetical protein